MRLFIAINLSETNKNIIENNIKLLKKSISENLKWTKKNQWHLTLKFLGETDENQINQIKTIMERSVRKQQPFSLLFKGIAAFPNLDYPSVIYLGVTEGTKKLKSINNYLEQEMSKIGFKESRNAFTPHITIARIRRSNDKKRVGRELNYFLAKNKNNLIETEMMANNISLIESTLHPSGAIYKNFYTVNI